MSSTRKGKWLWAPCLLAALLAACSLPNTRNSNSWNQKAAASYLDEREARWATWPAAARDHGTFCISCHTALAYSLSRPALRRALAEGAATAQEQKLLDSVIFRVRHWREIEPYYADRPSESRGTEAVLNALILASHDAQNGQLSEDTRSAFDHLWELQRTTGEEKGSWFWLHLSNEPWEAYDSQYYGASLAAAAVGIAPANYRVSPEIQANLQLLGGYLESNCATQSDINRAALLWASEKLPGLIEPDLQASILNEILGKQQSDGGWSLSSLIGSWRRRDGTPLVLKSDGYATGLVMLVAHGAGLPRDDVHISRGLSWLRNNQSWWNGHWSAYSLNLRRHNPFSNVARFMDDAATAYAVLALSQTNDESRDVASRSLAPSGTHTEHNW